MSALWLSLMTSYDFTVLTLMSRADLRMLACKRVSRSKHQCSFSQGFYELVGHTVGL